MDEAGGILIDADTGADECGVIGLGEKEYQFLSGMPGVMIRTSMPLSAAMHSSFCISLSIIR